MKNRIFFIVFFTCISIFAHAVCFRNLTTKEGLSHQEVMSISQDTLGRIWIGTRNGINVFDGKNIVSQKMFLTNDSTYFYANNIKAIVSDKYGDMYLKSSSNCIKYYMKQDRFEVLPLGTVTSLYAHKGQVYVSKSGKIFKLNSETNELSLVKAFVFGSIFNMLIDNSGAIWFSTKNELYCYSKQEVVKKLDNINIYSLFKASDGSIWASSVANGIYKFKDGILANTFTTANYRNKGLRVNRFRGIAEDGSHHMWFGSSNGLYKYDATKDTFELYKRSGMFSELSYSSIHRLYIDKDDNLWVGTYLGGVNSFSTSNTDFNFYEPRKSKYGLSHNIVGDITEDKDGNIWIGTEGGGLNCFDPKHKRFEHFIKSPLDNNRIENVTYLPQNNIKSIVYDEHRGNLYIGTSTNGLYTYNIANKKFQKVTIAERKKSLSVNSLSLAGNRLAISTNDKLFIRNLDEQKDSLFFSVSSDFYRYVSYVGNNKFLFVNNGINEIDLSNHSIQLQRLKIPYIIYFFVQATDGSIYLTTHGGGVYKWDPESNELESFNKKMKGLAKFCYQIAETKTGNLILTCDQGLCLIDKNGNILRFLEFGKTIPLGSFTKDCGLYVASDSSIYVGSTNGMLTFKENILPVPEKENIYFSELYLDGRRINPNDHEEIIQSALPFEKEIFIPYQHNKIEIHFASSSDILNSSVRRYRYRLLNIEDEWSYTSNNIITYTNLPSGKYTLEVMCRTKSNLEEPSSITITVLPPWYATWWAYLLWSSLFILVLATIIRIAYARQKAKRTILIERMENEKIKSINEVKFQFFTNVSHEFKTPLTLIIGQIEQLINGYKLPPTLHNKLYKIMRYSHQLGDLANELLEYTKYNKEEYILHIGKYSVNEFFSEICADFKDLAIRKNLHFSYDLCTKDTYIYIDKTQMAKVVNNLISNAFKFTPAEGKIHLKIDLNEEANELYFSVSDTGCGIKHSNLKLIFERYYQENDKELSKTDILNNGIGVGLALTKDIVEQHKGRIEVKSELNKGSIFTVTLKLGKAHFNENELLWCDDNTDNLIENGELEDYQITENKIVENSTPDKPTILIVEDNPDALEFLQSLFTPLFKVLTAEDGNQGLSIARKSNPDLVLSDCLMPNMTGTEMCSKIKNDIEISHIPVILLTALNLPQQQMNGYLAGADDYISKPFNSKLLVAKCNNIIRSKKLIYQKLSKQAETDLTLCATNTSDKKFLNKVDEFIENNLSSDFFSIDQLSEYVNMSRSSFYTKFKGLTGMTPNDYVNIKRLKTAATWLVKFKDKSINDISESLGFKSHNYFSTKFKDYYGITPQQYRKQNNANSKK